MDNIVIEKIQDSEMDEVAGILTDAFITNPAYSIIFKKENQRREGLLWLFKTNLFLLNQKQVLTNIVREKNTGKIIGTFTLIPPQGVKTSIFTRLQTGIPGFVLKFGINTLFRMLDLDKINKNVLKKSIQVPLYYYLSMVVVKKEYRAKGIGSCVIKQAIQELISSKPACSLLGLTTQLPENVIFYSRLGFVTLDEGYIDFKGDKYYNYNMRYNLYETNEHA